MLVRRKSGLTGKVHEMDLPITQEQLDRWYSGKGMIQHIFPDLTPDQREFIMTGATQQEWDEHFGEDDEEVVEE